MPNSSGGRLLEAPNVVLNFIIHLDQRLLGGSFGHRLLQLGHLFTERIERLSQTQSRLTSDGAREKTEISTIDTRVVLEPRHDEELHTLQGLQRDPSELSCRLRKIIQQDT